MYKKEELDASNKNKAFVKKADFWAENLIFQKNSWFWWKSIFLQYIVGIRKSIFLKKALFFRLMYQGCFSLVSMIKLCGLDEVINA